MGDGGEGSGRGITGGIGEPADILRRHLPQQGSRNVRGAEAKDIHVPVVAQRHEEMALDAGFAGAVQELRGGGMAGGIVVGGDVEADEVGREQERGDGRS